MRVLALNSSARGVKGVTHRLLTALGQGLAEGGARLDMVSISDLKIAPCLACLTCMHKTPGVCVQKDGMDEIYPLLKQSDILVLGTPVYADAMSAASKAVMERCICSLEPYLVRNAEGRWRHPSVWRMPPGFVLVSTCGFPEPATFGPLIATFRAQAANFGAQALAELCIPGSIAIQFKFGALDEHLELLRLAGSALASTGEIPATLAARINRPPLSVDSYLELAGRYEQWCRRNLAGDAKNP